MSVSNQWSDGPSNLHPTSHLTMPSRGRGLSKTSPESPTKHGTCSPSIRLPPSTPSRRKNQPAAPVTPTAPETPQQRKDNLSQRLRKINTSLPSNLSLTLIRSRLVSKLKLSYTLDDWQVHLIQRILQGYDSIFCAGTGYGKSLVFEGLAVLGGNRKLVVVISPLKALEYDQVS